MVATTVPLLLHAAALLFFYSLYGVLQEKIFKGEYGAAGQRFTSSSLLILVNRLFSISAAVCIIACKSRGQPLRASLRPARPLKSYVSVAVFNFLATTCQYEALRNVSYTSQSLAECAKMIPVVLLGHCVHGKRYDRGAFVAIARGLAQGHLAELVPQRPSAAA